MKTMKYLVAGLLLAGLSVPAMAQTSQADIDAITKVIVDAKGDAIATKDQVKAFKKTYKKDATAIAALGRAFLEAKNYQMAEEIANLAIKANGKSAEGYILLGDIAPHRDAVSAGNGLAADAHRLNGHAAPPQNIHRGQRLHLFKAFRQKYICCHFAFLLALFPAK